MSEKKEAHSIIVKEDGKINVKKDERILRIINTLINASPEVLVQVEAAIGKIQEDTQARTEKVLDKLAASVEDKKLKLDISGDIDYQPKLLTVDEAVLAHFRSIIYKPVWSEDDMKLIEKFFLIQSNLPSIHGNPDEMEAKTNEAQLDKNYIKREAVKTIDTRNDFKYGWHRKKIKVTYWVDQSTNAVMGVRLNYPVG